MFKRLITEAGLGRDSQVAKREGGQQTECLGLLHFKVCYPVPLRGDYCFIKRID